MKFCGKLTRLFWMAVCALGCAGCGGFNGSHSVSPASFFLPGIIKANPAPAEDVPAPQVEPANTVAQIR